MSEEPQLITKPYLVLVLEEYQTHEDLIEARFDYGTGGELNLDDPNERKFMIYALRELADHLESGEDFDDA